MGRTLSSVAIAMLGLAASWAGPETWAQQSAHSTPWRAKLKDTATTVAAARRIARKRRNLRARNPK